MGLFVFSCSYLVQNVQTLGKLSAHPFLQFQPQLNWSESVGCVDQELVEQDYHRRVNNMDVFSSIWALGKCCVQWGMMET